MPVKLGAHADKIYQGLATSADNVYVLELVEQRDGVAHVYSRVLQEEIQIESSIVHPLIKGAEIRRYSQPRYKNVVLFPYEVTADKALGLSESKLRTNYPLAFEYLCRNRVTLHERSKADPNSWWLYPYPKNLALYQRPKILSQVLSTEGNFTPDLDGRFYFLGSGTAGGNAISLRDPSRENTLFMVGILNSRVTRYYIEHVASGFRSGYFVYAKSSLMNLPLPSMDLDNPADKAMHDEMVRLVDQMLTLHHQLAAAGTDREKSGLQLQIAALDRAIDALVFRLYDISPIEARSIPSSP